MSPFTFLFFFSFFAVAFCQIPSDWAAGVAQSNLLYSPSEPLDQNFMPALSNGFLGTLVGAGGFSVAGIYNGYNYTTPSHRAVIPATLAFNITNGRVYACALDLLHGAYYRRSLVPAQNGGSVTVQETFYVHRAFRQLMVASITWLTSTPGATLTLLALALNVSASTDFTFSNMTNTSTLFAYAATTTQPEATGSPLAQIGVASDQVPSVLQLHAGQTISFLSVVHSSLEDIADPLAAAIEHLRMYRKLEESLFSLHCAAWESLWRSGIAVHGDTVLAAAVNASIYAIISNLRPDWPYGISPGGIATNAYNGHVFWDSETWMFPPNILLQPQLAASLLEYRALRTDGASTKAKSRGYEGFMFPWESAFTGQEVCPWIPGALYENHITADIAYALQVYFYATRNVTWLSDVAWPLLEGMSEFWLSRVLVDPTNSSQYVIDGVIPPDESAGQINKTLTIPVNNSVYTNMVVAAALRFTATAAQILGESVNPLWVEIASRLKVPFDHVHDRHLEYDSYAGEIINQADVALLQWPLCMPMNASTAYNDLSYYENVTDPNGFFTGDSIAWIALGELEAAFVEFNNSFLHIVPPFNVWNERAVGGHPHFITGAGGFLQNILYGYGGLRIQSDRLSATPLLPVGIPATGLEFRNIAYLDASFTLSYNATSMQLEQTSGQPLLFNGTQALQIGKAVTLTRSSFFLQQA